MVRSGTAEPDYGPGGVSLLSRIRARAAGSPTKGPVNYADLPAAEPASRHHPEGARGVARGYREREQGYSGRGAGVVPR